MRCVLLIFSLACVFFCGCKKEDDQPFSEAVAGTWNEQEAGAAFAGTTYHIRFSKDWTFQLTVDYWTDLITGDPCTDPHYIYSYGTYAVNNGVLDLSGYYSDSSFMHPVPHCSNGTKYQESFHIAFDKSNLVLHSDYINEYAKIRLVKQ